MSLGIYPIFQPELRNARFEALGESLAANFEALDHIAVALDLNPFTGFSENREIPEDFDGPPEELDELLGPCDEWFNAAGGKSSIQALLEGIKSTRKLARKLREPDSVLSELDELVRILTIAEEQGARFRLEIG